MKSYTVGRVQLEPILGDITHLDVDAVVQPSGTSPPGWPLQASPWVINADANGVITQALAKHAPLQIGQVIVTSAGDLKARYLLSAVVMDWALQHPAHLLLNDEVVAATARKCIAIARALGLRSVAFTPWGTRVGQVEASHVTAVMLHAIANELHQQPEALEVVYLISNNADHYRWFVDRVFVFGLLYNQLDQIQQGIIGLDVASSQKDHLLSLLDNVRNNFVVYNEIVEGDKISVGDISDTAGVAIGKDSSSDVK